MDKQMMWVDTARCTGCGLCVEVCPTGAMTMAAGKAHVDQGICIGCGACVDECAVDAIQPVLQGELIPVPERPVSTVYHRPGPLVETAGAAVAVAGMGLLVRTAGALARAAGRWLTRRFATARPSAPGASPSPGGGRGGRGGRRRRRRGGE